MKRSKADVGGYTLIEVMIVLAITASLFTSVAVMFNGRQATAAFNQAVRDFESKIQVLANDVATGSYNSGGITCTNSATGVTFSSTTGTQGKNLGCIFLGKMITVGLSPEGITKADVFTLAGSQYNSSGVDVLNLSEAKPRAVYSSTDSQIDVTDSYTFSNGLLLKSVYDIGLAKSTGGFGFLSELGGSSGPGNADSGSRSVELYSLYNNTITTIPNTNNRQANVTLINLTTNYIKATRGIRICVWDGGKRRGEITIGASGSQTSTEVTIDNGVSAECRNA